MLSATTTLTGLFEFVLVLFVAVLVFLGSAILLSKLLHCRYKHVFKSGAGELMLFQAFSKPEMVMYISALVTITFVMQVLDDHPKRPTFLITDMFLLVSVYYLLSKVTLITTRMRLFIGLTLRARHGIQWAIWATLSCTGIFLLRNFITHHNYYLVLSLVFGVVTIIQLRWMQTYMRPFEFREAVQEVNMLKIESDEGSFDF